MLLTATKAPGHSAAVAALMAAVIATATAVAAAATGALGAVNPGVANLHGGMVDAQAAHVRLQLSQHLCRVWLGCEEGVSQVCTRGAVSRYKAVRAVRLLLPPFKAKAPSPQLHWLPGGCARVR